MMTRKRVAAFAPGNHVNYTEHSSTQPIEPLLSTLMSGCYIAELDPDSCVHLFLSTQRSNNAMRKLKGIFTGQVANSIEVLPVVVSGSPNSVILPLVDDVEHIIDD